FEPTMGGNPSDAPNIIPGEHEIVFDCRILPRYRLDDILNDAKELAKEVEKKYTGAKIEIEVMQRVDTPEPTPKDSEIVTLLQKAIKLLRNREAKVGGIGGGTFAAYFRMLGIPAVVWATLDETAHQPNEYARIDNMVEDAKIMAVLALL
ncbi:MAG TPA: M20/M25/M40 family metallo-hydrolase, partial [Thermococcus paralvinellae]|nr:M20/M25/M40 family metallo-hydrolase [Thermococcus paralvinellae]